MKIEQLFENAAHHIEMSDFEKDRLANTQLCMIASSEGRLFSKYRFETMLITDVPKTITRQQLRTLVEKSDIDIAIANWSTVLGVINNFNKVGCCTWLQYVNDIKYGESTMDDFGV